MHHRTVVQAKALLMSADGAAIYEVARELKVSSNSVRRWRRRFEDEGLDGVGRIAPGRGRKSWLPEGTVAEVVRVTLEELPDDGSTHWTTRLMAERCGIGKDTVARIWQRHNLKPWELEIFKASSDPHFEKKLVDVVGFYLDPPERAIVFSFDEKTQVRALDRTQPSLPMTPGRAGTMTHDYGRHGTTDLFAAMNVATGEVFYDTKKSHKSTDVLAFYKLIDLHVPKDLVEGWFSQLTKRRLKRGTFTSVDDLVTAIELWAEHWNDDPKPFIWQKPAEEIIAKITRGRASLASINSATHH